jgi:putative sterol carrier protein
MGQAKENLMKIVEKMNENPKAQAVFVTNIAGKDVDWEMSFQFKLDDVEPFFLEVKNQAGKISDGIKSDAEIVISGESKAIERICEGKGDFTHAISREQITVEKGKVMDVIRLTRAITIVLKSK